MKLYLAGAGVSPDWVLAARGATYLLSVDRQVVLAYHGSDAFPGRIKLLRGQKKDGNQSEVTQCI